LLVYILGLWFTKNFILVFILTVILLAVDFYYLKNIAGRRLVGLRWWNEVNPQTGDSHWVFESADPETRTINATDRRFFWLALYAQPALWIVLGIVAILKIVTLTSITPFWISLVGKCSDLGQRTCNAVLTMGSHRSHPDHHKHSCLLAM
jgi:hypothetical protein